MLKQSPLAYVLAALSLAAACKDGGPPEIGPPAQIIVVSGNNQTALASTAVPQPIVVGVRDADGDNVGAGFTVDFTIFAGGGATIGAASGVTDANGNVAAPGFLLGRSNVPQVMRATSGAAQGDINATIQTQYNIVVRYFGSTPVSEANRALFEAAAARIEAFIVGDIADAQANNTDLAGPLACNEPGLPVVTEVVDDVVIYAAITPIDGPGSVLGSATPCLARPLNGTSGPRMVAYGFMKFDSADFGQPHFGDPQQVIIHEMLHVIGSGTLWEADRTLITGKGTADPRFTGPLARAQCAALGAPTTCATTVPLENTGGGGTRDFHWRDATFNAELMTGFLNPGVTNPLSAMTIASMADLSFTVNMAPAEPYTITGVPLVAARSAQAATLVAGWEQIGQLRGMLLPDGRVEAIRYK